MILKKPWYFDRFQCLAGDFLETAQLFSKEIENNADNVDAILDAAYTAPAFRDDGLLGLLLEKDEQSRR